MSTKVDFNTLIKVALKSGLAVTDAVSCATKRVAGTWLRVVSRIQECHQPLVPATLRGTIQAEGAISSHTLSAKITLPSNHS